MYESFSEDDVNPEPENNKETPSDILQQDINTVFDFDHSVKNVLLNSGIRTVDSLVQEYKALGAEGFLGFNRLGPAKLSIIQDFLKEHKLI